MNGVLQHAFVTYIEEYQTAHPCYMYMIPIFTVYQKLSLTFLRPVQIQISLRICAG